MAYNNFQGGLLNINNFKTIFPFIHFDLSKSNYENVKLTFHYELSGKTNNDYHIFLLFYMKNYIILKINDNLS